MESTARPTEALVESALWEASLFEEHGFGDIKISVSTNDPVVMVRRLRAAGRSPRLSLASRRHRGRARRSRAHQVPPWRSVRCCPGHRRHHPGRRCPPRRSKRSRSAPDPGIAEPAARGLEIVSCPSCGRPGRRLHLGWPTRGVGRSGGAGRATSVAVMGCVNGPGEACEADLGVASGNGKGPDLRQGRGGSRPCRRRRSSRRSSRKRCGSPSSRAARTHLPAVPLSVTVS